MYCMKSQQIGLDSTANSVRFTKIGQNRQWQLARPFHALFSRISCNTYLESLKHADQPQVIISWFQLGLQIYSLHHLMCHLLNMYPRITHPKGLRYDWLQKTSFGVSFKYTFIGMVQTIRRLGWVDVNYVWISFLIFCLFLLNRPCSVILNWKICILHCLAK